MLINKTFYVIGNIEANKTISMMKEDKCGWETFVYLSGDSLCMGNYQALKREKTRVVVLGAAPSRRLAQKLALYVVTTAFKLDHDIKNGLSKLIDI